jgi:tungstate transport system substrate-binding protein
MEINGVGSGQAFTLGRDGEADLVLAHDPDAQAAFEKDGFVDESREFARNDFVLVGPPSDPAGVASASSMADAFKQIADKGVTFISRGDKSGTNTRELKIWEASGAAHDKDWYVSTGQGMGETLRIAGEKEAYTLSDGATFRTAVKGDELKVLVDKGPLRDNIYVANVVSYKGKVSKDAKTFLAWLAEPSTVEYIQTFGEKQYGSPLFKPV